MSVRGGEAGLDLERRAAAGRQRSLRRDPAAGDEERPYVGGLSRPGARTQHASCPHAIEALELAADPLQRCDPVAKPAGVLEAASVGELAQPTLEARQRRRGPVELVRSQAPAPRAAPSGGSARDQVTDCY